MDDASARRRVEEFRRRAQRLREEAAALQVDLAASGLGSETAADPAAPYDDAQYEELGRRMLALFAALRRPSDHAGVLAEYSRGLEQINPAESVDVDAEGSWGWWARRLLQGEPRRPA